MPLGCDCDDPDSYLSVYGGQLAERCKNCDPEWVPEKYGAEQLFQK